MVDAWLVWLIIGILCTIIEIFDPAVFFISFGIAGLITSPLSILGIPVWSQILIFGVVSFIVFLLMRKVYEKLINKNAKETNVYALVGQTGSVKKALLNGSRGYVKIGGEEWSALSSDKKDILVDEQIEVLSVEGNKLIVKKI